MGEMLVYMLWAQEFIGLGVLYLSIAQKCFEYNHLGIQNNISITISRLGRLLVVSCFPKNE
jgi:hypothetical protein